MEVDYPTAIRQPHRWHYYVPQNVVIEKVVYVLFCTIDYSSLFMGAPAPTMNRKTTTTYSES
jgi:hypothetical protein